jgi:hypothetical protein
MTWVTAPADSPAYRAMASMAPVVSRVGQGTANLGTGTCVVPKDIWATMPSGRASAAWMHDRSTRCGASGHMPEKAVVRTVSAADARSRAST